MSVREGEALARPFRSPRKPYGAIAPEGSRVHQTFAGHVWLVAEGANVLGGVVAATGEGRAVIRSPRLTGMARRGITSLLGEVMVRASDPQPCVAHDHTRRQPTRRVPDRAFERAAAIFRVASEEARLRLLERLSEGKWCVSELAEAAGLGLSTVSQQLRLLRSAHLVKRRRSGKHVFYRLADAHVAEIIRSALDHAIEEHAHQDDDD